MQSINVDGYSLLVSRAYVCLNSESTLTFLVTRNITAIVRVRISFPKYIIAGFFVGLFLLWLVKLQSGRRLNDDETILAWLAFLVPLIAGLITYYATQKTILEIRSANGVISLDGHFSKETVEHLAEAVGKSMFEDRVNSSYQPSDST